MIDPAVLERVIWAPAQVQPLVYYYTDGTSATSGAWSPSRCRCCGRARDLNERLSFERDGSDHAQGCPVLDLLAALRAAP